MYKDFLCYPAVVEQGDEELGVFFPDLDGCITGGANIEEVVKNAREVLSLHLYGMEEDNDELPQPTNPCDIVLAKGQYLIMVDINFAIFRDKMSKKSVDRMITLPRYLNAAAKEKGINISQLLQDALKKHLQV